MMNQFSLLWIAVWNQVSVGQDIGYQVATGIEHFNGNMTTYDQEDCGADCIGKFAERT